MSTLDSASGRSRGLPAAEIITIPLLASLLVASVIVKAGLVAIALQAGAIIALGVLDLRAAFWFAVLMLPVTVTRSQFQSARAYFVIAAVPSALLALGTVRWLVSRPAQRPRDRDRRLWGSLLLLALLYTLVTPTRMTATYYVFAFASSASAFFLAREYASTRDGYDRLLTLLVAGLTVSASVAIVRAVGDGAEGGLYSLIYGDLARVVRTAGSERFLRTNFNSIETNFYAAVMDASSLIALLLCARAVARGEGARFVLGGLGFLASIGAIWYTRSRGALLVVVAALALAVALVPFRRLRGSQRLLVGGGMVLAVATGLVVLWHLATSGNAFLASRLRSLVGFDYSKADRLLLLVGSLQSVLHHPLGVGLGNNWLKSVRLEPYQNVHNVWLQIFVEGGVVLGAIWAVLLFRALRSTWLVAAVPGTAWWESVMLTALALSLAGSSMLEIAWLYDPVGAPLFWVLAGAAAGRLSPVVATQDQSKVPNAEPAPVTG